MRSFFIIIIYGILNYNIAFAQEYTTLKVEHIDNKYFVNKQYDISLKGSVKSVTIITHDGNYSCDTVKPNFDYSVFKNFPSGACWIVTCKVDTLVYHFDSNLMISKIISTNFLVIKENWGKLEKTEYNFKNGLIQSQNVIINGLIEDKTRYKHDSNNNLIKITKNSEKYKSIEIFKYNLHNSLIQKKGYLLHENYLYWPKLRNEEVYVYDASNNLIKKKWAENRVDFYKYDTLGNKIEEGYCSSLIEENCIYNPIEGFEYDSNNRLIKSFNLSPMIHYNTNTFYFYDCKGRLIEIKSYKIQKDTTLEGHTIFEYNSDDRISKQETLIGKPYWGNTSLHKYNKIVYHYDLNGNIIQQENFEYGSNSGPIIFVFQYIFDDKGNWTKKETWMGNAIDNLEKTKIEDRIIEYY